LTGFRQLSAESVSFEAVGCSFGHTNDFQTVLAIGNWFTNSASTNLSLNTDANITGTRRHLIWYNNKFHSVFGDSTTIGAWGNTASLTNCAFVQNEFEFIDLDGTTPKQSPFSSSTLEMDQVLFHHNTHLGARGVWHYNLASTGYKWRGCSIRNSIIMGLGWAHDTDGSSPSSTAIGNWHHIWNTGNSGNVIPQAMSVTHAEAEYANLMSYYRAGIGNRKSNAWYRFTSDQSVHDTITPVTTAGQGDYRLLSDSPIFFVPTVPLLDYDINLVPRGRWDPAGATAAGNIKKGGGFF
jgi:hypothetical protein